jgi:hypothetical protein
VAAINIFLATKTSGEKQVFRLKAEVKQVLRLKAEG